MGIGFVPLNETVDMKFVA